MIIGGLNETGETDGQSAIGQAINMAGRLQSAASPGTVVIDDATRELAGRFFEYRLVSAGVAPDGMGTDTGWGVLGPSRVAGRFDALHRASMTQLVGRKEELLQLERHWCQACMGVGQVVLITGDAGIGKSRLALALEQRTAGATILRYHGSQRRIDTSLFTVTSELEAAAGFSHDDTPVQKLAKLNAEFEEYGLHSSEACCLAELLSLPGRPADVAELSPQKRKERMFAALLSRVECVASRTAVMLQVEDAQWIDSTSLDFIGALVERAAKFRVMILITARPEFLPRWYALPHISNITLGRFGRGEAETLVAEVAGSKRLPRDVVEKILLRAEGVPLFLEEITKTVLEGSKPQRRGKHEPDPRTRPGIPRTLRASLLARIDRLGQGRDIAQIGAVIGREFSHELLSIVAGRRSPATLVAGLDQLVASGLVYRRGQPPHANYSFKHALVRDAAYDMLLRRPRQKWHAAIAEGLEQRFPETINNQPELLAHHWSEAGHVSKAIHYLAAAAERDIFRSGTAEASAHLTQAQDLVATLPESSERSQLELRLEFLVGRTLTARRSFTAPETREAYRRARIRCETLGNETLLPLVMLGQWAGAWSAAEHRFALQLGKELLAFGESNGAAPAQAVAQMALGMSFMVLGNLTASRLHLEMAAQINQFALPLRPPFLFADIDGRVSSLTFLHDCLLLLGYPDQAETIMRQVEILLNEDGALTRSQSYSRALTQHHALRMYTFRSDFEKIATVGAALFQLSQEQGYPYFIGSSLIYKGWALAHSGDPPRGVELCQQGLAQLQQIGVSCWFPRYLALLAECREKNGDVAGAFQAVAGALKSIESTKERVWECEIYRFMASLLLRTGKIEDAEKWCTKAMRNARRQGARILELRAATTLADLMLQDGRKTQARKVLEPVYRSFTEGFDWRDLQQAKALLNRLSTN